MRAVKRNATDKSKRGGRGSDDFTPLTQAGRPRRATAPAFALREPSEEEESDPSTGTDEIARKTTAGSVIASRPRTYTAQAALVSSGVGTASGSADDDVVDSSPPPRELITYDRGSLNRVSSVRPVSRDTDLAETEDEDDDDYASPLQRPALQQANGQRASAVPIRLRNAQFSKATLSHADTPEFHALPSISSVRMQQPARNAVDVSTAKGNIRSLADTSSSAILNFIGS